MSLNNKITICAVGDISPGDHYFTVGHGTKSTFDSRLPNYTFLFDYVKEIFKNADITICNLEGVLSGHNQDNENFESLVFRGASDFAKALKLSNINVVGVANNHIMQHGPIAFKDTVKALSDEGLGVIGAKSDHFNSDPLFVDIQGSTFGILGYSLENEVYCNGEECYSNVEFDQILEDIREIRSDADYLIISIHHGIEGVLYPSEDQVLKYRKLIDSGADIVLGHHSHTYQGVEKYKNGLICYSLGNFIFDLNWYKHYKSSIILQITFDSESGISYCEIPIVINNHYQPVVALEKSLLLRNKSVCCNHLPETTKLIIAFKKIIFFFLNIFKGRSDLKLAFVINKIRKKIRL